MNERRTTTMPAGDVDTVYDGDCPAGLHVGVIRLDDLNRAGGLEDKARDHLLANPHILEHARRTGKNIAAIAKTRSRVLIVSAVGVALLAGSIVIYEHEKHKPGKTPPTNKK